MPDPTDEAFARLQGGAAVADPTEAAFARLTAKDPTEAAFAQLSALREPDPGTIDYNALPATSPQQSTTAGPPRQDFGLGAAKDRATMDSIPMQAAAEYGRHLVDTTVRPPIETMKRWFTDPGVQREKQAQFEEAQTKRAAERLPQINVMPAEIASAMGLPLTRNPLTGRMEGPRASQPSDAQSAALPAPGASWGSQVTRNIGEVPGVAFGVQPEVLAMNAAFTAPAAAVEQARREGYDPGRTGKALEIPQQAQEAVFGGARRLGARMAQGAVEAVNRPTMEDVTSSSQYRRPIEERGIGPTAGGIAELAAGIPIFGAAEKFLRKTPSARTIGRGTSAPDISKPPAFDIPEAKVEPALPRAMPEKPAPIPSLRAGDRPIPPSELAALGDEAWQGVEPSAAKPAGRVERLRQSYADVKPGEEFEPFRGAEGPEAATRDVSATARIVDEGGGKFAAEGAIGYGDEPMRLIGKGTLDEAKAHVARWADEQLRELEGQETGAPKPVEAEVTDTAPKALPSPAKPAEAPPSPPPASGQAPAAPTPEPIPPRYREDPFRPGVMVNQYGRALPDKPAWYREMAPESLEELLLGNRTIGEYHGWFADSPDLALGQGRGASGIKVKFDRELGLNATTFKKGAKPGIGMTGLTEMEMNLPYRDAYNAIREVTIPKEHLKGTRLGRMWNRRLRPDLEQAGFTIEDNGKTLVARRSPAAPSAPDVPGVPPREGPTIGVGLGALGTKPEGWIEAIEKPYERTIGKGVAKVVDPALNLFKSPEAKISPEFEKAVQEGRATERGLSAEAKRAVKQFEKGTKGVTPEQNVQIGRSLSSEDADLSGLTPEQRAAVEEFRGKAESVRAQEVKAGTLSPEAQAEYGQGHLKRVVKPGMIAERRVARAGGVTIKAYQTAKDMFGIKVDLPAEEVRALVPRDSPLRYLKQEGRSTLLKFTNSPEGMKARDAFYENVKSRFADARSKLSADTTREIRAGDVGQAKQFAKAQADVPRVGDLGVEKFDPIPEDVADRIFVKDTAQRAHVTLQESARRIGKAETLKNIADVVDSKGPVAIEPDGPRAETPEGYTLVDNKNFGPLHRKFVRNDVLEYVKGAFEPQQKHFLTELGDGLMERFKTVRLLDPRMVPRQAISNMEFENLMGMSNWNPRYLQWKAKGLAAMREGSPYRAALERNGFLQSGVVTEAEIGLAENALAEGGSVGKRIGRAIGSLGLTELAPGALKRAESVGWKAYSYMDAWTKATGYVHAIEELGMSPADAAAYVRKWTPSPESVATWVQGYSKHLVGDPWARYRAEMARINLQALKEKPIRLSMNRLQKNLIRGAAIAAGASLLSDDEEKALKSEQGGGAVALGRDEQGRPLALNYTFLSTLGDFFSQPKTVGKPWDDAKETFLRWSGLGDNPLYSTGSQLLTGENARTGKPINPEGTVEGGLKSFLALAASQWTPSMLSTHLNKLQAAWNDEAYSPNQPKQTKEQAILDVFFGLKLTPLDAQQALQKITRQGGRAYDDIATMFRGQALRGEAIDPEKARDLANMLAKDYSERAEPLNRIATEQAKRKIGAGK